jgi:inhibitor of KinA
VIAVVNGGIVRVTAAGDAAIVAEFPSRIDPDINARATALAAAMRTRWGAILRDVVVGYCTVTVYYDPLRVDAPWLEAELAAAAMQGDEICQPDQAVVEIPVCYGGDFGPDLEDVARFGGCSTDDVVALHSGREYRVYVVGFVPGFAYMAEVDQRIAAPRRSSPRIAVPAGSVAIAGGQTGIYPGVTPGGWNIIGRTLVKPFDPSRLEPFLFQPGDRVRFAAIPAGEFGEIA